MFSLIKLTSRPDIQADSSKKEWATAPIAFQTPAHILSFLLAKRTEINALSEDCENRKSPSSRFLRERQQLEGGGGGLWSKGCCLGRGTCAGKRFTLRAGVGVEMLAVSFGVGGVL